MLPNKTVKVYTKHGNKTLILEHSKQFVTEVSFLALSK